MHINYMKKRSASGSTKVVPVLLEFLLENSLDTAKLFVEVIVLHRNVAFLLEEGRKHVDIILVLIKKI